MQLIRHPQGERRTYRKIKNRIKKPSDLLDALYPRRKTSWNPPTNRRFKETPLRVSLKNFSFIDAPINTLNILKDIAKAEAREFAFKMDFLDPICHDIGPYLVLGVMRQRMLPNCEGGQITEGLSKVLPAVGLDKFLEMNIPRSSNFDVLPFPIKSGAREDIGEDHIGVTTKQRAVDQFTDTLNGWLNALSLGLKEAGKGFIGQIIGEAIDNAERHSDSADGVGRWWIAGFMTVRFNDKNEPTYHCHVGLLSLGCSIAESIARGPQEIQDEIAAFTQKHKSSHQSPETLSTVYALQDGVTRDPPGGVGMMDLFGLVSTLGKTQTAVKGSVAIISGDAYIVAKDIFIVPEGEPGERRLWFNKENSIEHPPQHDYVFSLPFDFPGTLVTLRFQIDPEHLLSVVDNNGDTRP
jgi:hypothetical protein